jgi:putative flippase GtrA
VPAAGAEARSGALIQRGHHLTRRLRLSRYAMGSLICFGVSEVVFVALFASHVLGARGASVSASIVGVVPGYYLNRTWTWGRRGRSDFRREVLPYWLTALASTALASFGTGGLNAAFASEPRVTRTVIDALGYMAIYGAIFGAKYLLFQNWLFAAAALRSGEPAPSPATPAGRCAG